MPDDNHSPPPSRPQLPGIGTSFSLLARAAGHRAQLASLELDEVRTHAVTSAVLAAATVTLALLAGFAATLFAAALVWESPHREWWLAGLTFTYVAIAGTAVILLVRRMRSWQPFAETKNQLVQDYQCVRQLIDQAAH